MRSVTAAVAARGGASGQRVRCAVVGLGQGLEDVYVALRHPRFELVAACDRNRAPYDWITGRARLEDAGRDISTSPGHLRLVQESREALAQRSLDYIADYDEVLARGDIDAVILVVPDTLHEDFTVRALHAGKYVLCTKPMAITMDSAFSIADVARQHPGHYMLGFQMSYSAFAQALLGVVADGVIGQPRQIRFDFHREPWRPMHRRKHAAIDGSVFKEGTHWLDLFYRLNGMQPWTATGSRASRTCSRATRPRWLWRGTAWSSAPRSPTSTGGTARS